MSTDPSLYGCRSEGWLAGGLTLALDNGRSVSAPLEVWVMVLLRNMPAHARENIFSEIETLLAQQQSLTTDDKDEFRIIRVS